MKIGQIFFEISFGAMKKYFISISLRTVLPGITGQMHVIPLSQKKKNLPKITVSCERTSGRIVNSFIFRDTMNAKWYLTMFQREIWPVVDTLENIDNVILMKDNTPAHFYIVPE